MPEALTRVGRLYIETDAKRNVVIVVEEEQDAPPEIFESVVIRTPLEAETLARILADQFGASSFKVIKQRSPGKRFGS